jgi:hypothetical protein
LLTLTTALAAAVVFSGSAAASEIIDRLPQQPTKKDVQLKVNAKGEALLSFMDAGKKKNVLVWGAVNAIPPSPSKPQVKFKVDFAGGWGKYRDKAYAANFKDTCKPYSGQALYWLVTACTAADGSHWAVQSWQRALPNYGLEASPTQAVWEIRLSHWTGDVPVLAIKVDWVEWGKQRVYDHLYGTFTYNGEAVHGFKATPQGNPLDTHGRNLYVDTLNSEYGSGWKRENSFLAQPPMGGFCYGFYPHGERPVGKGEAYRATIIGPGVTPDAFWSSPAPGNYDEGVDKIADEEQAKLFEGSKWCQRT